MKISYTPMMDTITLSDKQWSFLTKLQDMIGEYSYSYGNSGPIAWDMKTEWNFIDSILQKGEYLMHHDSDRLNTLGELYKELKLLDSLTKL